MQALAYKAYGQFTQRTADAKAIEYTLFVQITEALEQVLDQRGPDVALWADSLHRNMQLWSLMATDLVHPDNALPVELKRSLISLSEFVRRTSHDVLAGKEGLADLIAVNRTIMAGLAGAPSISEGEVG